MEKDLFTEGLDLKEQTTGTNTHYFQIRNGEFIKRVEPNTPGSVSRINAKGNEVWEQKIQVVYGEVISIYTRMNMFDNEEVTIAVKNPKSNALAVISFNRESSYGNSFYSQIFNVDFSKKIAFFPYSYVDKSTGKNKTGLSLRYGAAWDERVTWGLPEGTPEIKWIETKKGNVKDVASYVAHAEYLDKLLEELIDSEGLRYEPQSAEQFLDEEAKEEAKQEKKALDSELKEMKKNAKKKDKIEIEPQEEEDDFFNF